MTAELGRQPWLVYGILRTQDGYSATVSSGNTIFSLLGFMGLYLVLGVLFVLLALREIGHGPESEPVPIRTKSGGGGAGGAPHTEVPSAFNEGR
jgi:cytochrome d ubiquinol oxidase subunit I